MPKEKEWPVAHSMEGIFGVAGNLIDSKYIKGWLPELMKPLNNVVVFACFSDDNDDIEFIDVFREEPLKTLQNKFPSLCSFLREAYSTEDEWYEKVCRYNDARAVKYLHYYVNAAVFGVNFEQTHIPEKPAKWEALCTYEGLTVYKYLCEETCFVELIVPVIVNFSSDENSNKIDKKVIGAFVSGQFIQDAKPVESDICDKVCGIIKERMNIEVSEGTQCRISEECKKNNPIPPNEKLQEFIVSVMEFSKKITERFHERRNTFTAKLQSKLNGLLWLKSSSIDVLGNEVENSHKRLEQLNQYLIRGINYIVRDEAVAFTRFCVIKNNKSIKEYDMSKSDVLTGKIRGIWVDGGDITYMHQWTPSVDLSCINWRNLINEAWSGITVKAMSYVDFESDDVYLSILEELFPGITDYSTINNISPMSFAIFIFATQDHKNYPLIFIVEDNNSLRICDKNIIKTILEGVAQIYLTQWNEIFSNFQRVLIETSSNYFDHEIGQLQIGMRAITSEASDALDNAISSLLVEIGSPKEYTSESVLNTLKDKMYFKNNSLFEQAAKTLLYVKDFAKDMTNMNALLEMLSKNQFSSLINIKPTIEDFKPYGDCLFSVRDMYKRQCKGGNKEMYMTSLKQLKERFSLNNQVFMRTDKSIFFIVVNNLIRNAVKYSWPGTAIYVDCDYNAQKNCHILEVINYGKHMPQDEADKIFDFKMRGSNSRGLHHMPGSTKNDFQGMGIGLYLVKQLVTNALKGEITFDKTEISNACVPMLQNLTEEQMKAFSFDHNIDYYNEYKKLLDNGLYAKIISQKGKGLNLRNNENSLVSNKLRSVRSFLKWPTDEYKFTVEIPQYASK